MIDAILFYVFAALALGSALVVIGQRHAIYSAFALIVTLCSLSAIYGLLGSPFIAVLQLVVYAGAIMVLFLFVIMLLNVGREEREGGERSGLKIAAGILTGVLLLQAGAVLLQAVVAPAPGFDASTHKMAQDLFSPRYLYAFEATSILILASIVGAVALAKKDL